MARLGNGARHFFGFERRDSRSRGGQLLRPRHVNVTGTMQRGRSPSTIVADRMRTFGWAALPTPARAALALLLFGVSLAGAPACTLLLDTSGTPSKCETDGDCIRFPNAACDGIKKECVPRQPYTDGGTLDAGAGGTSGLTCELSFDNKARIHLSGPDGGLRPLPEDP
jgi:hypothetical protein